MLHRNFITFNYFGSTAIFFFQRLRIFTFFYHIELGGPFFVTLISRFIMLHRLLITSSEIVLRSLRLYPGEKIYQNFFQKLFSDSRKSSEFIKSISDLFFSETWSCFQVWVTCAVDFWHLDKNLRPKKIIRIPDFWNVKKSDFLVDFFFWIIFVYWE